MASSLTIGQLAQATGVSANHSLLRTGRRVAAPTSQCPGYRQYSQRDVHRLLFIRRARALGLSLHDLRDLTHARRHYGHSGSLSAAHSNCPASLARGISA
jgi:DNA-binding transcriptional MerR regulator